MTIDTLERAFGLTRGILSNVSSDQHGDPTPCESWTVRDLANHIVEGANWFALCVNAGEAPDPDPTHGVDYAARDLLASYDEGVTATLAAFRAPGALERMLVLPFGEMPGAAFLSMATNDAFVHGWDLATATRQPNDLAPDIAEELLGEMGAMISDDFRGADTVAPFGPVAEASGATSAADRLASFLGRKLPGD